MPDDERTAREEYYEEAYEKLKQLQEDLESFKQTLDEAQNEVEDSEE